MIMDREPATDWGRPIQNAALDQAMLSLKQEQDAKAQKADAFRRQGIQLLHQLERDAQEAPSEAVTRRELSEFVQSLLLWSHGLRR